MIYYYYSSFYLNMVVQKMFVFSCFAFCGNYFAVSLDLNNCINEYSIITSNGNDSQNCKNEPQEQIK